MNTCQRLGFEYVGVDWNRLLVRDTTADIFVWDFLDRPQSYEQRYEKLLDYVGRCAGHLIVLPPSRLRDQLSLVPLDCEYCFLNFDNLDELELRLSHLFLRHCILPGATGMRLDRPADQVRSQHSATENVRVSRRGAQRNG